jgi:hypothetical protein
VLRSHVLALKAALFCSSVLIVYCRLSPIAGNAIWPAVAWAAVARGRWEERSVAVVIAVAVVATRLSRPAELGAPQYGVLVVDAIETIFLTVIAVRSRLWWPSWCAACHIASLSTHGLYMLASGLMDAWTYVSALLIWSWLGFMPLAFGTLDACLRRYMPRQATA